jgi:hypothetical protein
MSIRAPDSTHTKLATGIMNALREGEDSDERAARWRNTPKLRNGMVPMGRTAITTPSRPHTFRFPGLRVTSTSKTVDTSVEMPLIATNRKHTVSPVRTSPREFANGFSADDRGVMLGVHQQLTDALDNGSIATDDGTGCGFLFRVTALSFIPGVSTFLFGMLTLVVHLSDDAALAFEQVTGGALFLTYTRELFSKSVGNARIDRQQVKTSLKKLEDLDAASSPHSTGGRRLTQTERSQLFAILSTLTSTASLCDRLLILATAVAGVVASVLVIGISDGNFQSVYRLSLGSRDQKCPTEIHLVDANMSVAGSGAVWAWRNQTAERAAEKSQVELAPLGDTIPYFLAFASDGLVLAYDNKLAKPFRWTDILLPLIMAIDNAIDVFGIASLIENVTFAQDSKWLFFLLFALSTPVGAAVITSVRFFANDDWSVYVHTFLRSFGAASIAAGALEAISAGFNLYVLIGFALSWLLSFVLDAASESLVT